MGALRKALWCVATSLAVVAAGAGTAWLWSDMDTSLATSLALLEHKLPAGQRLEVSGVSGSLRQGGRIERLHWQQGDLQVEVQDVVVHWSWRALLDGALQVDRLAIGRMHVDDQRPATPGRATPPEDLRLPLQVDAQWSVDQLQWTGGFAVTAKALSGRYVFDNAQHRLIAGRAHVASGNYTVDASLQAIAPLTLNAQLDGTVQTLLPGRKDAVDIVASASVRGTLAGADAALDVQAALTPPTETKANSSRQSINQMMWAQANASVQPWKRQPLVQARAQWQALDLAALWAEAPHTRLGGEAMLAPDGEGWRTAIQASNATPGPWNQQHLPIEQLDARLTYRQHRWSLESLQARGAQGRIDAHAEAQTSKPLDGWLGQATVTAINPAAIDTRLGTASLDGTLNAQQADGGIRFKAQLKDVGSGKARVAGLRLQNLQTEGLWKAPVLQLDALSVQTDDAQLNGKLTFNTTNSAAQGEWALQLPGTEGTARFQMASAQGNGELHLQTRDAGLTHRWLAHLPGVSRDLATAKVAGEAALEARWNGGWHDKGRAISVTATLRAPRLDWAAASAPDNAAWHLRDAQVDLSGALPVLALHGQAQAERGLQRFTIEVKAQGGRRDDGSWNAQLDTAGLTMQDTRRAGVWALQLADRVTLTWKQSGSATTLENSGGSLRLTGPVPGTAVVTWQAGRWSHSDLGGQPRSQWNTQGRFNDLPMAWLEPFSPTPWSDMGFKGDVVLGGEWDASNSDRLRLRARVERTRGDLQVRPDEDAPAVLAGIKLARLELDTDDDQLHASLRWDSERAGQAQADVSTRLQRQDGSWTWPQDAPLSGQFKAQLPPVGVWAVLAPPGWRLRGTLDADATLSGTRDNPQWRGQLGAQDLAMRSVVDGIDFSHGTLRTRLDGERLEIDEFSFQGAGGATGGQVTAKGFVQWQSTGDTDGNALGRLRMELGATAKSLRISARSDRRLMLSGTLSAKLEAAKLLIRGNLKADQALFVLPEDSTPRLGDDVVVRKPAGSDKATAPVTTATPTTSPRIQPDLLVTLDLGQDFQVRGAGLATLLEGALELRNVPQTLKPRLSGTLRTAQGTYKAYGQQLDIEEGVLRFTGPYDNPSLDILAIRPNLTQRVGVQISGTALLPVVRLYAEPDLPDSEKLAWLLLGRSGANGGAETAMLQQAAMALLGSRGGGVSGSFADAFGLDEMSVRGASDANTSATSSASTGTTTATGATVTLGKRLSRDFYVAYERSLAGTMGTLSIFYDLSRRFTLRAQTGEQSAVDLIFTLRYD